LDAAILNPMDQRLMGLLKAAEALLDRDPFCQRYIEAYRKGILK
jgi:5-methyltetrahydrofolate--homocysteine methyltransferase